MKKIYRFAINSAALGDLLIADNEKVRANAECVVHAAVWEGYFKFARDWDLDPNEIPGYEDACEKMIAQIRSEAEARARNY